MKKLTIFILSLFLMIIGITSYSQARYSYKWYYNGPRGGTYYYSKGGHKQYR